MGGVGGSAEDGAAGIGMSGGVAMMGGSLTDLPLRYSLAVYGISCESTLSTGMLAVGGMAIGDP